MHLLFLNRVACRPEALGDDCTWTDQGVERLDFKPLQLAWELPSEPEIHMHTSFRDLSTKVGAK